MKEKFTISHFFFSLTLVRITTGNQSLNQVHKKKKFTCIQYCHFLEQYFHSLQNIAILSMQKVTSTLIDIEVCHTEWLLVRPVT
jgi:hypothetical protein